MRQVVDDFLSLPETTICFLTLPRPGRTCAEASGNTAIGLLKLRGQENDWLAVGFEGEQTSEHGEG